MRTRFLSLVAVVFGVVVLGQVARAQPAPATMPAGSPRPLVYQTERWDEDYSYLRDPAARSDYADPLKFVPLDEKGDSYVTFGGQFRDRYESFNHSFFGSGPQDRDGYNLARLDLYADLHLTPYFRIFVDGRSALENGRTGGPRGTDLDDIDAQQAFGELDLPLGNDAKLAIRAGRQELQFGAERLIGPADFNNVRRTFDGVRGTLNTSNNQLDVFLTRPVVISRYDFDNANNSVAFGGIYDTLKLPEFLPGAASKLELYGLYLKRNAVSYPDVVGKGNERRYTAGARFTTNPKPWDVDIEADYQGGRFLSEDIEAYSLSSTLGYTAEGVALTPHPFIGFDIASGDNNPNRGPLETFNQLFPTGHTYFGYVDVVGRQNIIDLHPGVDLTLLEKVPYVQKLTLRAEYHQFWRQSVHDSLYDATGAAIRSGLSNDRRNIGSEIDTLFKWQIDRHWSSYIGYSHFFRGSFIGQSGPNKDIDFTYVAATYTF